MPATPPRSGVKAIPFPDIDPVLFDFGIFQIRWYALAYIFGLVLGWQYVRLLLKTDHLWAEKDWCAFPRKMTTWIVPFTKVGISVPKLSFDKRTQKKFQVRAPGTPLHVDDLLLWAAVGVIIGGRLGYVFLYAMWYEGLRDFYIENPLRIFMVWQGGMAFHGGLIGVFIAVILFSRRYRLDPVRLGDAIAPAAPIGLFFGRIANFINGELWGKVTDAPWGVIFPHPQAGPLPRHPSQLYEAALEGLLLFTILYVVVHYTRALQRPGLVTGLFLVGYSMARFSVEFVRETQSFVFSPDHWFTVGMLYSLPMAAIGAAFIWWGLKHGPQNAAKSDAP